MAYGRLHEGTVISNGCQWSTATCFSLNAQVSIRSTRPTLPPNKYVPGVLSLEEIFFKKKPNRNCSSRKVTRSEFRTEDTQISLRHGIKFDPHGRPTANCTVALKNEDSRLQLITCELFNRSTKLITVINYGILILYIKICNNKPPHLCRNMQQFICIINGAPATAYVGWYVDCKKGHGITKNKDKHFICGHNILTGVTVTQLPSNVRISLCCNVWLTTDCRSMTVCDFILTQIIQNIL